MAETWADYFQPGEQLLWEGSPVKGIRGKAKLIGMSLFGLPFLVIGTGFCGIGLGMLFNASDWQMAALGLFIALFSLPFAGLGLYLVFGGWIAQAQAHRRVRYALSNRAAYIAQTWWKQTLESYPILPATSTGLEKGRGADTVWFHVRNEKDSDGDRSTTRIGFDNIADGDKVFHLIRSIQTGSP
jgi:hypothetical protein